MWPGLGEWDQIGCTFWYENPCSYIYSSIYLEIRLKPLHSWTQKQQKISSTCSMWKNCTLPSNDSINHDQFTMWMEWEIKMETLSTIQIWKCKQEIGKCGSDSSSLILQIKRLFWDTLGSLQCSLKLTGLEDGSIAVNFHLSCIQEWLQNYRSANAYTPQLVEKANQDITHQS